MLQTESKVQAHLQAICGTLNFRTNFSLAAQDAPRVSPAWPWVEAEAMARGSALINTTNVAAEDFFTPRVESFIVPIRSPEVMTTRFRQLDDEPMLC